MMMNMHSPVSRSGPDFTSECIVGHLAQPAYGHRLTLTLTLTLTLIVTLTWHSRPMGIDLIHSSTSGSSAGLPRISGVSTIPVASVELRRCL